MSKIQLNRALPAPVTSIMAIQRLRELAFEKQVKDGRVPTASTFAQKTASPMDQLIQFANICRWLLSQLGGKLTQFSEFDEPNSIASEIINQCKNYVDIQNLLPHELRQGSGDSVSALLLALTEAVLAQKQVQQIQWIPKTQNAMAAAEEEDEEPSEDDMNEVFSGAIQQNQGTLKNQRSAQIAPGVADVHRWTEECNAAEAQLNATKYSIVTSDWRADVTKLIGLAKKLHEETTGIAQQLFVVGDGLAKQIEQLKQRESSINQQISAFSGKLIEISRKHGLLGKEAEDITAEIQILGDQLQETTEKCKRSKNEMNTESSRINDNSGVAFAKQAVATLSAEIRQLDLRIILAQQKLFSIQVAHSRHQ